MKKLLIFFMALLANFSAYADDPIDVPLYIINEGAASNGTIKTPTRPLYITLEDKIITLPATPVDYMLELRDENGILVYYTFIPQGTTQIVLPSTLSGDFEIRLVADTYYYIGYLSL